MQAGFGEIDTKLLAAAVTTVTGAILMHSGTVKSLSAIRTKLTRLKALGFSLSTLDSALRSRLRDEVPVHSAGVAGLSREEVVSQNRIMKKSFSRVNR